MAALLEAAAVRLDVAGVPEVDGLDLAAQGGRIWVLGAPRSLFEAAAGLRGVSHGALRAEGKAPLDAVRTGTVAGAPYEPALPPKWTVAEYVTWSARLAGNPRRSARGLSLEAMDSLELGGLARTRLAALAPTARRATVVAAALATGAGTLLLDDPLAGLPDDSVGPFARLVARALALGARRWAVFAPRLPLETALAAAAEEAIVLDGAAVVAQGAPASLAAARTTLAVRVNGAPEAVAAFASAVASAGGKVWQTGQGGVGAREPLARGAVNSLSAVCTLCVERGPLSPGDLFRLAVDAGATLLELRPLAFLLS